jgi:hypothetical protein
VAIILVRLSILIRYRASDQMVVTNKHFNRLGSIVVPFNCAS